MRWFRKIGIVLAAFLFIAETTGCGVRESVNTLKEYYSYTAEQKNENPEEAGLATPEPVSVREEPAPTQENITPEVPEKEETAAAQDTGVKEETTGIQDAIIKEETAAAQESVPAQESPAPTQSPAPASDTLDRGGSYTTAEDVSLYLVLYGELPPNFITKKEAQKLGWNGGSLEPYAPGKCIGGDYFGNYEGLLPQDHKYRECDIDTLGAEKRGSKRLIYSDDGLIYYTKDHYASFQLLYGEE